MNSRLRTNLKTGLKTRSPHTGFRQRLVVFVIAVLILGLFTVTGRTWLQSVVTLVGRPFWQTQSFLGDQTGGFFSYFAFKNSLSAENQALKDQLFTQQANLMKLAAVEQENQELKSLLGRNEKKNLLMVAVLRTPGFSPYDTFLVDGGTDAGLTVGDKVFFAGDFLAGYVFEVSARTALVKLYSSPDEKLDVVIGAKNILAEAVGRGDGTFEVKAPREVGMAKGSTVLFPGSPVKVVGVIETIETDIAHSEETALFRLPFSLSETHFLFVERKSSR